MRIAHFGDTHVKNLKYHEEYREVFNNIYDILRKEQVDVIVHSGDLAHTKTQLSPEYFDLAVDFLRNLADIAPTHLILGNHDANTKNMNRQDAVSPIIKAMNHSNLFLHKYSKDVDLGEDIVLNIFSIFDKEEWKLEPLNIDKTNIVLYHGAVKGVTTDVGWVVEHGDFELSNFEKFDYGMLGDIHKTNQKLDDEGKIRYCGSTIQQNHGETNDKGFLIWDIEDKETFDVRQITIPNPRPFLTIELTKKGRIPNNTRLNEGARIRLVSNNPISFDALKRTMDITKQRFKPESVTFLSRNLASNTIGELADTLIQENLRDVAVQEDLMKEYLKEYQIDEDVLEKIYELNRKYNSIIHQDEEIIRNVHWELKSFEWDNLFNYGRGNKIDFSSMRGTAGIFGKNFSGKSSVIDSLLYTIYNSISKKSGKNLNIINQNKEYGSGIVEIVIGDETYVIERKSEKYEKKLHGKVSTEASTVVDFYKYNILDDKTSLNGDSRPETDKNIRKIFGTIEDFLLTSMSHQFGSQVFINEGSTKRKEILAKFLDLEIFDKKYKLAKEDAADIRGALRLLSGRDFNSEIDRVKTEIHINEASLKKQQEKCRTLEDKEEKIVEEINEFQLMIDSIPTEIIDISDVNRELQEREDFIEKTFLENKGYTSEIKSSKDKIKRIDNFFDTTFDVEEYKKKKKEIKRRKKELDEISYNIKSDEDKRKENVKTANLLNEVPCGDSFPQCKLLKSAHNATKHIKQLDKQIREIYDAKEKIEEVVKELNPKQVEQYLDKYEKLIHKKAELTSLIGEQKLSRQTNKNKLLSNRHKIKELKKKIQEYEDNKEAIENLEQIVAKKEKKENVLTSLKSELSECADDVVNYLQQRGSFKQKLENLVEKKEELQTLNEQYEAYDLFLRCTHSDGISYDIIKKRLPIINEEISKILANVVTFEVFFENDGRKLDIFIKHPKYDARPLEMGSGAEKEISAMAIRLALLSVSSLPKPDIFILDEPGTSMDEENVDGFVRILDLVKSYFKSVILISHMDSLKDVVDTQIVIEKTRNGYARVEHKE